MPEVNKTAGMLASTTSAKIANMGIVCAFLVLVLHWGAPQDLGTVSWYCSQFCQGVANIAVACRLTITESIVVLASRAIMGFFVACCLTWLMRKHMPRGAAVLFGGR